MVTDLGKDIQHQEPQPQARGIKPFLRGIKKIGPEGKYEGRESWVSPETEVRSLGETQAIITIPRDEQAVEESPEFAHNRPVFVVDRNGEISEGTSDDYLKDYGALWIRLGPPEKIFHELHDRQDLLGKKVPEVRVDVIVGIKGSKFRGLIEDILGEDAVYEFRMEDSEGEPIGKPKPVLFPADEEFLKKINIGFETPKGFGNGH